MAPIKIKHRETEKYAMNQPTFIRVSIKDGVVEDNREKHFAVTLHELSKGSKGGRSSSDK